MNSNLAKENICMENDIMKQEWVDVYRPTKLKDYVLS